MLRYIVPILLVLSFTSFADDSKVLTIDRSVSSNVVLSFPNDQKIKPKANDFELDNYVLMSNEVGERWAVITLTNSSSGNRVLQQDHLMALLADGERKIPMEFKLNFEPSETQSITVSFGKSKFPILSISAKAGI